MIPSGTERHSTMQYMTNSTVQNKKDDRRQMSIPNFKKIEQTETEQTILFVSTKRQNKRC